MKKPEAIKRNNILAYILFALSVPFSIMYAAYLIFLKDYTILFESLPIRADILNVIILGICTAMMIFKDKRIGKVALVLLSISVILLPVNRYLMACVLRSSYTLVGIWDTVIYLAAAVVMIITACFYTKNEGSKILAALLFSIIFVFSGCLTVGSYLFSYGKNRDIAEFPAPDGVHSVRVIEYADDDNDSWLYKAVFAYNSEESFSVGPVEFVKDFLIINHFRENSVPFDENTQITFPDNKTVKIQDEIYTYDGKRVIEP